MCCVFICMLCTPRNFIVVVQFSSVRYVPVIIEEEQWRLVYMCHEGVSTTVEAKTVSGHFGRDKTVSLLTSKVFFPGITNKVRQFVESCDTSESDGDDDQGPPIGTNSPLSNDADTILYAGSEDDKGIPGHSSGVLILGCTSSSDETIEKEIGQIPRHTSSGDSDETIEIDVIGEILGSTALGVQWKQLKC